MPLRYSPHRLKLNRNKLRVLLRNLQEALSIVDEEWASYLDLTPNQYKKYLDGAIDLNAEALYTLSEKTEIDLKNFLNGSLNLSAIARSVPGTTDETIPEVYRVAAFSKRLSSINLLDCVEEFFGWEYRYSALKHLGMKESSFRDPNKRINIRFLSDLCVYLHKNGLNDNTLKALGSHSVITYMDTPIGKQLARCQTVPSVYEKLFEDLIGKYIEKNFFYRLLSLSDDGCVIEGKPNPELQDAFHTRFIGNEKFCLTKVGVASSVPGYLGLPFAKTTEKKCIHRGDPACWFEVDYSFPVHQLN